MPAFTPGQVLTAAALNSMADDIAKSLSFFSIVTDFGAVNDFVASPGSTGAGTDNSTQFDSAMATGKPLWIPPGHFYVGSSSTRAAYAKYPSYGPGTVWGMTNVGKTKIGKLVSIGTTRSHELESVGGLLLGGESGHGIRQWMGHQNWMQWQPTKPGAPTQIQVYPNVCCGLATPESPNILRATHGIFDTNLMTVGDHFGYGSDVYKIAGFGSSTLMTVTKFDGSSPAFVTDPSNVQTFYHSYETATGTCNTSGTAVTYVSGEQYPFGLSGDHMYAIINGTKFNVTQGPESINANSLTLATSAGVQTNVSIQFRRCWGYFAYVSLLRLQGLGGGVETNCGLYLNIRNEAVLFNGGYGSNYYGDMRINARRIFMGVGDGTGGTESMEVGNGYVILGRTYGSTAGNYVEVDSLGVAYAPIMKAEGPGANMDIVVSGKGSGGVQFGIGTNVIKAFPASNDFAPSLAVRNGLGTTNPNFGLDMQGYGIFMFTCGAFARTAMRLYANNATGYLALGSHNTAPFVGVEGTADNIDLQLSAKGTGVLRQKSMPVLDVSGATWQSVGLGNGFTLFGPGTPVGYRLEPNRVVRLKGSLGTAGATNAATAFTLPDGFRPTQTSLFPGYGSSFIQINTDGSVRPSWSTDPGLITLDGITFSTV